MLIYTLPFIFIAGLIVGAYIATTRQRKLFQPQIGQLEKALHAKNRELRTLRKALDPKRSYQRHLNFTRDHL